MKGLCLMKEQIFALDIGTRSVTGIILNQDKEGFEVIDFCMIEHNHRSMCDGQIHDVVAVANTINQVKEKLEQSHGTLTKVCVAAAGRSLITMNGTATLSLQNQPIKDSEIVQHLELSAVQDALEKVSQQEQVANTYPYYCVGYSVLHYYIDEQQIGSLIDQRGEVASTKIIATFLPKVVVESLLAALSRAELEMEALTLEPIAAMDVLIPESMRRLNVALVDIGAGTSDIAITNHGTVAAYGMVAVAGDEITEAISDTYLLDFPDAETFKRAIVQHKEAKAQDILGFETTISYKQLTKDITSAIDFLAAKITEEILKLNGKPPKAVMLIGGGSLTPKITKMIAKKLELPENRVAVRDISAIKQLTLNENLPIQPDFVTPIGIAIAAKRNPVHYISVYLNELTLRLFEMRTLTVGDCFIQAGIDVHKWYGRPGAASIITVNGRKITLPGELGEPPQIMLNGTVTTVDKPVKNGDYIQIERGKDGQSATITLYELIGEVKPMTVWFENHQHTISPTFFVNQQPAKKDDVIQDNDIIDWFQPKRLQDVIKQLSSIEYDRIKPFSIFVNGKEVQLSIGEAQFFINQQKVDPSHLLYDGDHIEIIQGKQPNVQDLLAQEGKNYWRSITVFFNGKKIQLNQPAYIVKRKDERLKGDSLLDRGDKLQISTQNNGFIYQDVFQHVDLDLSSASGKFQVYKNKQPAQFHESIQPGDELEIIWSE